MIDRAQLNAQISALLKKCGANFTLVISPGDDGSVVQGAVQYEKTQTTIPVAGVVGADQRVQLHLAAAAKSTLRLSDLSDLITASALNEYLPIGVQLLESTAFELKVLELNLSVADNTDVPLALKATAELPTNSSEWPLLKDFPITLKNIGTTLQAKFVQIEAIAEPSLFFTGNVHGTIHLGGDFTISMPFTGGDILEIDIEPKDGSILPGFADLAAFIGGDSLKMALEGGLDTLKQVAKLEIGIDAVKIVFKLSDQSLYYLAILSHVSIGALRIDCLTQPPLGSAEGWHFAGSTGQPITIGALIKCFDDRAEPPAVLETFTIEHLGVSFNTASTDFTFTCEGKFKVENTDVDTVVSIAITHPSKNETKIDFSGEVTVGPLKFTGQITHEKSAQAVLLTYSPEPPGTAEEIKIKELVQQISQPIGDAMPELTIGLKHALFAYENTEGSAFLFGVDLDINAKINTANLGPIGPLLGGQEVGLDNLRVLVASRNFTTGQVNTLNQLLTADGIEALPFPSAEGVEHSDDKTIALAKGVNVSGALKLGSLNPSPLLLPAAGAGAAPAATTPQEPPAESSTAKWIDIKKSLGPLYFSRVGFQYEDQKIGLLLDAAVDLAGLHIGLLGFQIRFPLQALRELTVPEFGLDGLELAYAGGPVQISGSFLRFRQENKPDQYDGMALIKAANFTITGFGSYTTVEGAPSLFIYAILHAELGGPPFFRVRGLAAGFGYNRKLTLPPIEEVHKFPLVRAALDEKFITKGTSVGNVLGMLRHYIAPSYGDYWLAVGIRFNSFEMIQSFAMLSVSFGHEVEIGLLGLSQLSVPPQLSGTEDVRPLAYAALALRVVVKPAEGIIAVEGRLTDESYIFSKDCRLTGGFALFLWLAGPHAGDFVVTLGGYHPKFVPPPHYPVVPRLGVHWQVSQELTITAEMYFALIPSCLMAGGRLSVVYDSRTIQARFLAYADFLLSWQPFFYTIDMGVFIAVRVELEILAIDIHLSAEMHLWGPEFAGQIDVDLHIISFTIHFGAPKALPAPLTAEQFTKAFLPPARSDVLVTQVTSGLLRQDTREGHDEPLRVVNAHALALSVQSLIPVTAFDGLATKAAAIPAAEVLGVRPMGKTTLQSRLSVSMHNVMNNADVTRDNLRVSRREYGVPEALWSKAEQEGKVPEPVAKAEPIRATVGIDISFDPIHPQGALPAMDIATFAYETFNRPIPWDPTRETRESSLPRFGDQTHTKIDAVMSEVMSDETIRKRHAILKLLGRQRPDLQKVTVDLKELVKHRASYFQADPIVCALGSVNESIA